MRRAHFAISLALALALALAATANGRGQVVDPSAAVPDALRGHLGNERFAPVATVGALPAGLHDGLKTLFGGSTLDLAEPGAPFQATDLMVTPRLPARRLIAAGCASDHCLVHYERGGYAHLYYAVVFKVSAEGTRFEWGGLMAGPQPDLEDVKKALVSGKVLGQSKYW
jgi:hypothetical protein